MTLETYIPELFSAAGSAIRDLFAPPLLAAYLLGVLATLSQARLLTLAIVILAFADLASRVGLVETTPLALFVMCLVLALIGVLQAVLHALLGPEGAPAALSTLTMSMLSGAVFLLWSGPRRLLTGNEPREDESNV
ncbi:hypothetical protein RXV86_21930 [Alisedimentitalea sp. MJ-SS2]|uniref:hypothetical protein n=1 Tax=Aliisedimentitalea sp. MJ-SS2 TaxID=3049795 RepID=UPI002912FF83|nr:hypothetical protein [Alisedimentitalea sp. MJ-SS2]MDU8930055.1 hypothetical protein [Alisedimentitalea sp. MJ-SS2]